MSAPVLQSFVLRGNLNDERLTETFANSEVLRGPYKICVKSIAVLQKNEDLNEILEVSTNLLRDRRYNKQSGGIDVINPVIGSVAINIENNKKKIFKFDSDWFTINSPGKKARFFKALHFYLLAAAS